MVELTDKYHIHTIKGSRVVVEARDLKIKVENDRTVDAVTRGGVVRIVLDDDIREIRDKTSKLLFVRRVVRV